MIQLPIDVIPGTHPPRFKWKQKVSTPVGTRVVDGEGPLPPSVEQAVIDLIALAIGQSDQIEQLKKQVEAKQAPSLKSRKG